MTYTLAANGTAVHRDADGAAIPADPANTDWIAYQTWVAAGNKPTPAPSPPISTLVAYAQAAQAKLLAAGTIFNVAASGSAPLNILCDGTDATRGDLALLALFGQTSPAGTKTWLDNNGVATVLTGTELITLATLAGNWVSDSYPALAALVAEINATPPTITTTAQIDAYAWPAS